MGRLGPGLALWLACAAQALAQDDDACLRQFDVERARIERDMAQQRPVKGDRAAEERWAKNLHAALKLAATNAEQCRRAANVPTPAAKAKEQDCFARVRAASAELDKRFGGSRTLTLAEQTAYRDGQQRLHGEMLACAIVPRR